MDIRKRLSTKMSVKHWNRLPREGVESPALEGFKRCLHVLLRTQFSGGLDSAGLMVRLDLKPKDLPTEGFSDSVRKYRKAASHLSDL